MAGGDLGLPVSDLIGAVKNAIRRTNVSVTDRDRDLEVTSVYLKLNTIATATAGGGLDFRIPFVGLKISIGASVVHQTTHAMEMTLISEGAAPVFETRDSVIENAFVEAINTVRAVMAHADEGDDRFVLKDSVVEISFGLTEDGNISLGIEGELKDEITHTMRLSLVRAC